MGIGDSIFLPAILDRNFHRAIYLNGQGNRINFFCRLVTASFTTSQRCTCLGLVIIPMDAQRRTSMAMVTSTFGSTTTVPEQVGASRLI